jgi:hypothetical protein
MRPSVVFAIVALAAAACGMMYLFLERPRPPEPARAPQEAGIAASDALTTALNRLTEDVRELRAMLRERGDLARDLRDRAASPPAAGGRGQPEEAGGGAPGARRPSESVPSLNGRVADPPAPEKRRKFDELKTVPWDQMARSHWFLTYDDILDRYGTPDAISPQENGTVIFHYNLTTGQALVTFHSGTVIGFSAPR